MNKNELIYFANETKFFCKMIIDNGLIDDNFKPFGGIIQNKDRNDKVAELMGIKPKEWFNEIQKFDINRNVLYQKIINIKDESLRAYAISRTIKTRVAFSDEWFLDTIGCTHNPNKYDHNWDNRINNIEFDIKSTYTTYDKKNEFHNLEGIINNPEGFIKDKYRLSSSSSSNKPSERGHQGQLNNRLFIINNSEVSYKNRFLVECGNKGRFEALEYLSKNLSNDKIFEIKAYNNNDDSYYYIKSVIFIINQIDDKNIEYKIIN